MRPLPVISNSTSSCISITGEPLKIEGTIHTQLSFPCSGSAPYSGTFLVSSNLFQPLQCIFGWDFLTHNSLQLSCTESGVYSTVDIQLHAAQRVSEFIPLVESDLLATTLSENKTSITCSTATPVAIQHQLEAALSPSLNVHEKQNTLSTLLRFSDVF